MPTRRPKVPRPAAAKSAGTKPGGTTSGDAKSSGTAPAGVKPAGARSAGTKAARPAAERQGRPKDAGGAAAASDARAAIRSQLSGDIRRQDGPGPDRSRKRAAAGPGEAPGTELRPVPAKAFSGRLLVLAMVMVAITVLLAPSVRTYLQQRSDIAAAKAEIAQAQEVQAELEVQLGRWEDPAYIKQQARDRIFLVMPGETRYLVKGENGVEEADRQAAEEAPEDLQWVDSLWDSVKRSATAQ